MMTPMLSPALEADLTRLAGQALVRPADTLAELQALEATLPAAELQAAALPLARARGLAEVCHGELRGLERLLAAQRASAAAPARLRFDLARTLAIAYAHTGLHDDSLEWARHALELARQAQDPQAQAEALLSCGVAISRGGDAEQGLALYAQALEGFEALGLARMQLAVRNNMGINLKNLGRPAEALAQFEQALALAQAHDLHDSAALLRTNLPEPLAQLGRLNEARAVGEQAAEEHARRSHPAGETTARIALGLVLLECGEQERAAAQFERALALCQQTGDRLTLQRAHWQLSQLHKRAGRHQQALEHLEAAHEAERAQFNEDSDRRRRALQVQAELLAAQADADQQRLRRLELERAHAELRSLHERLQAADREKTRLLARLAEESRTDALTGLANRRQFDERLALEWPRSPALQLALIDVDHFKQVNDRFGHILGDAVLQALAQPLREARADLALRLGGEEFGLLFLHGDRARALQACEALCERLRRQDWAALHPELRITVSIGLAGRAERAGVPDLPAALYACADERLYAAKRAGRDRVVGA